MEQVSSEKWRQSPGQACLCRINWTEDLRKTQAIRPPLHKNHPNQRISASQVSLNKAKSPGNSHSICCANPCQARQNRCWKLSAEIRLNKIWMEKAIYKLSIHVSNLTQWVSRRQRTQPGLREYEKQMIWVINCERADTLRGRSLTPKEGMVMCKLWLRIWLCINIKFCGIIPACLGLKTATVVLLFFFTSW